jgi:hypothetical protein
MLSPRTVIDWADRHPWAGVAFAAPEKIIGLGDRNPWAAAAFAVPLTIVGLGLVIAYPVVFVPLLVLVGVALVGMDYLAELQAPAKPNRGLRAGQATEQANPKRPRPELEAEAAEAEARAAETRARAIRLRLDEAEARAAEARARAIRLRYEVEARRQTGSSVE